LHGDCVSAVCDCRGAVAWDSMYETFDHTADLGLRVRAPDLDTLFAEAAEALFSVLVDDPGTVAESRTLELDIVGDDREFLLFDWLRTLLYHFDAEHLLFRRFEVHVRPDGLHATVRGEPVDRSRHELGHEVKAITYHGLRVEQTPDGWLAEVIVDI
jgi:protein archease